MSAKSVYVELEGQKVKLSNLEKVLFPESGITKAELIQYYLSIKDYIVPWVSGRPITMIRYPDGISKERFYSKNLPKWTPDWINRTRHGGGTDNDFLVIDNIASLIWSANLASLELHSTQTSISHPESADHFIFDLDPPEDFDFEIVKDLAIKLKPYLESLGYHPYLKTSGSRGLHIYVPIHPIYPIARSYATIKDIAKEFIRMNTDVTLILSKKKRKGKVLLDIYRNHKSQTCAIPLGTRGKSGCPISMPLHWDDLSKLKTSMQYTIRNAGDYLSNGFAWEDFFEQRTYLHDDTEHALQLKADLLKEYDAKRSFSKTDEPIPDIKRQRGATRFCIQIHDASNLHYDLRLEKDGVLMSWAIPKGMPLVGEMRLAIQTEPHPVKYLTFEGKIPKGEYGGGEMWIFDIGSYKSITWKDDSLKFNLIGEHFKGTYKLYKTKDNLWLIESVDEDNVFEDEILEPQLASMGTDIPSSKDYFFELKWDGIRAVVYKQKDKILIRSRSGSDLTSKFPAIVEACQGMEATYGIFDAEIVVLDEKGAPVFGKVVGRMHLKNELSILKASKHSVATCYIFDCLYLDGRSLIDDSIERRRCWAAIQFKSGLHLRFSESFEDGNMLFKMAKDHGLEGVMAKRIGSKYDAGKRTKSWLKIKVRTQIKLAVIGYTKGEGDRKHSFGALHSAEQLPDGKMFYRGKIGTGFDQVKIKTLLEKFKKLETTDKPDYIERYEEKESIWFEPVYYVLVNYASLTPDGILREPVFERLV